MFHHSIFFTFGREVRNMEKIKISKKKKKFPHLFFFCNVITKKNKADITLFTRLIPIAGQHFVVIFFFFF